MGEKTLYNGISKKCAAYCKKHHCGLTTKQLKGRECLRKECWHFMKNEEHPYWKQRRAIANKRKARKQALMYQNTAGEMAMTA